MKKYDFKVVVLEVMDRGNWQPERMRIHDRYRWGGRRTGILTFFQFGSQVMPLILCVPLSEHWRTFPQSKLSHNKFIN